MRTPAVLWLVTFLALLAAPAHGDERAPGVESSELRTALQRELERQLRPLPALERARLVGTYVAIDANTSDPFAQVACDEDGDHVIVLSEAMLRLVGHVARAIAFDEVNGSHKSRDYAAFLARAQHPSRRLLPPPPGFYDGDDSTPPFDERTTEAFAFVLAREVAHLRAGDLVCPRPTATKESGDDVWTLDERRTATELRARVYAQNRDEAAWQFILDDEHGEKGGLGLLRFFGELETALRPRASAWPTYLAIHTGAAALAKAHATERKADEKSAR